MHTKDANVGAFGNDFEKRVLRPERARVAGLAIGTRLMHATDRPRTEMTVDMLVASAMRRTMSGRRRFLEDDEIGRRFVDDGRDVEFAAGAAKLDVVTQSGQRHVASDSRATMVRYG